MRLYILFLTVVKILLIPVNGIVNHKFFDAAVWWFVVLRRN